MLFQIVCNFQELKLVGKALEGSDGNPLEKVIKKELKDLHGMGIRTRQLRVINLMYDLNDICSEWRQKKLEWVDMSSVPLAC